MTPAELKKQKHSDDYAAGLKEGARRERRWFLNYARNNFNVLGLEREFAEFEKKVAARSKRKTTS